MTASPCSPVAPTWTLRAEAAPDGWVAAFVQAEVFARLPPDAPGARQVCALCREASVLVALAGDDGTALGFAALRRERADLMNLGTLKIGSWPAAAARLVDAALAVQARWCWPRLELHLHDLSEDSPGPWGPGR